MRGPRICLKQCSRDGDVGGPPVPLLKERCSNPSRFSLATGDTGVHHYRGIATKAKNCGSRVVLSHAAVLAYRHKPVTFFGKLNTFLKLKSYLTFIGSPKMGGEMGVGSAHGRSSAKAGSVPGSMTKSCVTSGN